MNLIPATFRRSALAQGRTLAVSEAALKGANGKLLAFGTETCSIFAAANLAAR
ncbi:hypothetical protein NKH14_10935 [Mesorhizobium sp. M1380]|uniref:hypothetical protein n=1 Tax=Mesorhizobium sp. M1380 TaxID=2957093 RepID=UPI0033374B03